MSGLYLLLLFVLHLSRVTPYWLYESLNVTQWQWQSSVVVYNWLYIDGGELYAIDNGNPTFFYLGQTISIDLSKSWTNATVQQYEKEAQRPTTDGHWSKKPSLFYDPTNDQVMQWGGWPYNDGDIPKEFFFTPNTSGVVDWSQINSSITSNLSQNAPAPAVFGAAFVASNTSFYSLGGVVAEEAAPPDTAVQGLVEYDYGTNTWTNTSSEGATVNGFLVGAQASYTPGSDQGGFGQAGYLVVLGGNDPETQLFDPESPSLADMSNITLYDIAGQAWYHQTATGTIPPPRQYFCSVAATSIQATFEIFVLGGSTNSTFDQDHANDTDYLNVFTLSIPAFRWFKSTDSDQVRRADHSCQLVGNKQMLVIGGTQPSNPLGIAAVDPWPNGMGVFDMSAFAWSNSYDPLAAEYEQPEAVRNYYTYEYQAPVWDSPALEAAFAWSPPDLPTGTYTGSYPSDTSISSTSARTAAPTSSPTPVPPPSGNHTGAIVGGVVGGVAAIILALILIFLLRKRRSIVKEEERPKPEVSSIVIPKHELPSPLSSPGFLVPSDKERESGLERYHEFEMEKEMDARGGLIELESPELSPRAELESRSIRRKPVPELP